jgi:hypothetical protein
MMNNYLFKTYRGQFNLNKLLEESVNLVGLPYICIYFTITLSGESSPKINFLKLKLGVFLQSSIHSTSGQPQKYVYEINYL